MKRTYYLLALLTLNIFFVSCTKPTVEEIEPEIQACCGDDNHIPPPPPPPPGDN